MRPVYLYTSVCVCVFTCLSDLLINNDPITNTRGKSIFLDVVEAMNKVVAGDVLKQNSLNLDFEIKILKKEMNGLS